MLRGLIVELTHVEVIALILFVLVILGIRYPGARSWILKMAGFFRWGNGRKNGDKGSS